MLSWAVRNEMGDLYFFEIDGKVAARRRLKARHQDSEWVYDYYGRCRNAYTVGMISPARSRSY